VARIEAGRISLEPEPVTVAPLLHEIAGLVAPLAETAHVTVAVEQPAGDVWVLADRGRLRQVMLNLLTNAVKYNHAGGHVWLAVDQPYGPDLLQGTDEVVGIVVRDTGPGIPSDQVERLFTPFERLDADGSGVEGTGLGLAIARGLTEAMGGALTVRSVMGQGSSFRVALPRSPAPAGRDAVGSAGLPATLLDEPAVHGTVLYIEDTRANLELVEQVLDARPGVRLLSAETGEEGITLACLERPDLILLDLKLPDLSGADVLARLRDHPSTNHIPVVIVSADATPGRADQLLADGAAAYLTKPLAISHLLHTLDEHLASTGASIGRSS
jgi:CheY-like chemotaxis protein